MTLMEMMVVIALIGVVLVGVLPSMGAMMGLERHTAAKRLAASYRFLHEEAALRNVSFRFAINLDAGSWAVQVGDPGTLIFNSEEERVDFERELQDELARYTQRELEEGAAAEVAEKIGRFDSVTEMVLHSLAGELETRDGREPAVYLPTGARFASVQTAQYDGPVVPSDEPPEELTDEVVAYTTIFPNGTMEPALIRIVDEDDPDDGVTLVVEPLTGMVELVDEELELDEWLDWLPEQGPELTL